MLRFFKPIIKKFQDNSIPTVFVYIKSAPLLSLNSSKLKDILYLCDYS